MGPTADLRENAEGLASSPGRQTTPQCGLLPLRAFTTFAVQGRYGDEPEELGLDRGAWCQRAETLIEHVQNRLG